MTANERLRVLVDSIPAQIAAIDERVLCAKPAPDKWSKKEILGHLIDSAVNNHQRFIRAQLEEPYVVPRYAQDEWVKRNAWQQLDSAHIIRLWEVFNRQLTEVISRIPPKKLASGCITGDGHVTLGWLIDDYVDHLEHHLRQILA